VLDAVMDTPIAGAEIFLDDVFRSQPDATSGDDGCFEIASARNARMLAVRADGYGFETWHLAYPSKEPIPFVLGRSECGNDFPLSAGAKVLGRVVDDHEEPVTSGVVVAYGEEAKQWVGDPRWHDPWGLVAYEERTEPLLSVAPYGSLDGQGCFEIRACPASKPLYLLVMSERVLREFSEPIVLQPEAVVDVDLKVSRAAVIRGVATLPQGYELVDRGIWIWPHLGTLVLGQERWAPIAPDGSFTSGPLWPDELNLRFELRLPTDPDWQPPRSKEIVVSLQEDELLEISVDLSDLVP
jgi:hypothetical protein